MRLARVLDAPRLAERGVALMYVLLQLYRKVLCLHGRISRACQTRPARVSDMFTRYLRAELYYSIQDFPPSTFVTSTAQVGSLTHWPVPLPMYQS